MREDESDAAKIDAELDATSAEPEADHPAGARLWWQNDPRFTDRFKPTQ
jgi:hypothetical protein